MGSTATDVHQMDAAEVYRSTVEVCRSIGRLEGEGIPFGWKADGIEQRLDRLISGPFHFPGWVK